MSFLKLILSHFNDLFENCWPEVRARGLGFSAKARCETSFLVLRFLHLNIFLRTVCDEFAARYGRPDSQFPCFYSQIDPQRVITELDFQEASQTDRKSKQQRNQLKIVFSDI